LKQKKVEEPKKTAKPLEVLPKKTEVAPKKDVSSKLSE